MGNDLMSRYLFGAVAGVVFGIWFILSYKRLAAGKAAQYRATARYLEKRPNLLVFLGLIPAALGSLFLVIVVLHFVGAAGRPLTVLEIVVALVGGASLLWTSIYYAFFHRRAARSVTASLQRGSDRLTAQPWTMLLWGILMVAVGCLFAV